VVQFELPHHDPPPLPPKEWIAKVPVKKLEEIRPLYTHTHTHTHTHIYMYIYMSTDIT